MTWEEVEACLEAGIRTCSSSSPTRSIRRVEEHGDLFAPVLELKQKLPKVEVLGA